MKNAIQLILAAAGMALVGWFFWHLAGSQGFGIISSLALVAVTADNIRLRRELHARQAR